MGGHKKRKRFTEKSLVSRFLFSRLAITILLLLIQLFFLISVFLWLGRYGTYIMSGMTVLSLVIMIYIVNSKENPSYKLAWIIPIILFPILGTFFYLYVRADWGTQASRTLLRTAIKDTKEYAHTDDEVRADIHRDNPMIAQISDYLETAGGHPTYKNTHIDYYPLGDDFFPALLEELKKAESFIFMEYFILEEGRFWDSILEVLEQKAAEGVEVRVMYDDLGCVALVPRTYVKTLESKGLKARAYSKLRAFFSTSYNNRDHRKITVIDGKAAFNGGINLADEYINEKQVYGHWKDTAYKVTGDAVRGYTMMFLHMWNVSLQKEKEDYDKYLGVEAPRPTSDCQGYVIPYGDGPHQSEKVAEHVYMDIMHCARRYVSIMTPYLILDSEFLQTLIHTAKRGVEVKLLLPHIPDKWPAIVIARSFYPELIEAGVRVYEYTPGFVHAKMFVADDEMAVVGTINLDFRSLYLHYECGGFFYKNAVVEKIVKDFEETFAKSQRMTLSSYKKMKFIDRTAGRVLRLIGPLM